MRDWLDAGYAWLTDGFDSTMRGLFDDLVWAETVEEQKRATDAIEADISWQKSEHARAEAAARRSKKGSTPRPARTKRVGDDALAAAAAEWGGIASPTTGDESTT